jgi:hypothetical protein
MGGEVAATLLSRLAVPVVYYMIARRGRAEELRRESLLPAAEPTAVPLSAPVAAHE